MVRNGAFGAPSGFGRQTTWQLGASYDLTVAKLFGQYTRYMAANEPGCTCDESFHQSCQLSAVSRQLRTWLKAASSQPEATPAFPAEDKYRVLPPPSFPNTAEPMPPSSYPQPYHAR